MSAGDKHESADNVPIAAPALSSAAQTLTSGSENAVLRPPELNVQLRNLQRDHAGAVTRKKGLFVTPLYKWGAG